MSQTSKVGTEFIEKEWWNIPKRTISRKISRIVRVKFKSIKLSKMKKYMSNKIQNSIYLNCKPLFNKRTLLQFKQNNIGSNFFKTKMA